MGQAQTKEQKATQRHVPPPLPQTAVVRHEVPAKPAHDAPGRPGCADAPTASHHDPKADAMAVASRKEAAMSQSINSITVKEAIFGRRSVRTFEKEPIDRPSLNALLAAAVRAPTAVHGEPWQFVIVEDRKRLKRLSDLAKVSFVTEAARLHADHPGLNVFSEPGFNVFYDAPTLIVICAKAAGQFAVADCWLAAQNLMLAAHSMGFGTCVIGSAAAALNTPDIKHDLGIPAETTVVAPIIVGRPRGESRPSPRSEPQVLAWR